MKKSLDAKIKEDKLLVKIFSLTFLFCFTVFGIILIYGLYLGFTMQRMLLNFIDAFFLVNIVFIIFVMTIFIEHQDRIKKLEKEFDDYKYINSK